MNIEFILSDTGMLHWMFTHGDKLALKFIQIQIVSSVDKVAYFGQNMRQ